MIRTIRFGGVAVLSAAWFCAGPAWADGDAARGAAAYKIRCAVCHSAEANGVGPRHAGVVGRAAGAVPGFRYSAALKASGITWDAKSLDQWLSNPEALVPGQTMGVNVSEAAVRADVIAYLATLTARP